MLMDVRFAIKDCCVDTENLVVFIAGQEDKLFINVQWLIGYLQECYVMSNRHNIKKDKFMLLHREVYKGYKKKLAGLNKVSV